AFRVGQGREPRGGEADEVLHQPATSSGTGFGRVSTVSASRRRKLSPMIFRTSSPEKPRSTRPCVSTGKAAESFIQSGIWISDNGTAELRLPFPVRHHRMYSRGRL